MTGRRTPLGPLSLALLGLALFVGCGGEASEPTTPAAGSNESRGGSLDLAKLATYRALVLPKDSERAWEQIEWQISYEDGLRASSKEQKPLLLWVMNGHPLGCT